MNQTYILFTVLALCLAFTGARVVKKRSSSVYTGPNCITSCEGRADGDYQSCLGCHVYATCANYILHDDRPCAPSTTELVWDDNLKRCEWESDTCSTDSSPCDPNPCLNGGQCEADGNGYLCDCPDGYGGHNCENEEFDPCDPNPCENGGECIHRDDHYYCHCPPTHHGSHCELESDACECHDCLNGGECVPDGDGGYTCDCPQRFYGHYCEVEKEDCQGHVCANGGECVGDGQGSYTCNCPLGFEGDFCEQESDQGCRGHACANGGECEADGEGGYTCSCPAGFVGAYCQHEVPPCKGHACANGGKCEVDGEGGYTCKCPAGFVGEYCQHEEDSCRGHACANGGECVSDGQGGYTCNCPAGFEGEYCQHEVPNPCDPNPCQNGGVCHQDSSEDGFSCSCPEGYHGKYCDEAPGYSGQCWECKDGQSSQEHCNATAIAVTCNNDNFVCATEVKNQNGVIGVRKECYNANGCQNNQDKNEESCQYGLIPPGHGCYYCCNEYDLCNWDQIEFQPIDGLSNHNLVLKKKTFRRYGSKN